LACSATSPSAFLNPCIFHLHRFPDQVGEFGGEAAPAAADDGCGCRVVAAPPASIAGLFAALALAALAVARRRR
jgi:MYXO-CTERM domain-containing protein